MCSTVRIHHYFGRRTASSGGISESMDAEAWAKYARIANAAEWRREALRRFGRYPNSRDTEADESRSS